MASPTNGHVNGMNGHANGVNGFGASKLKPNVVVIGGSYVGCKFVEYAGAAMHQTHNIVLVEKNTHFQHLFAFPRFAVLPGYEHFAFIPYSVTPFLNPAASFPPDVPRPSFLSDPNGSTPADAISILRATATQILPNKVIIDCGHGASKELEYEYLVLATGTRLSPPGSLHTEGKVSGVEYFQQHQASIKNADRIVIIGGGAIGVQMATDIKEYYPTKSVTIVHSRAHLMNTFHPRLHDIIMERAKELGIDVVLEDRVKIPSGGFPVGKGPFEVELMSGKRLGCDFAIMCTGQTPLSEPLLSLSPSSISVSKHILVKPTLQIQDDRYPNVFAIGDVANTGAQKAARPGFGQGRIVAENIRMLEDAKTSGGQPDLRTYSSDSGGIHLTLGMARNVKFRNPPANAPGAEPGIKMSDDGHADMKIMKQWKTRAPGAKDYYA